MTQSILRRRVATTLLALLGCLLLTPAGATPRSGEQAYADECASCHDSGAARMPSREALAGLTPGAIVQALETGLMRVVGTFNLNGPERVAVAESSPAVIVQLPV